MNKIIRNNVLLVNEENNIIGISDKKAAHLKPILHRAFSIFIFNTEKELLLLQRAKNKYHTPSLWSNTCCSHPQPGEDLENSARLRLQEEMGFSCSLRLEGNIIYKFKLSEELDKYLGVYASKQIPLKITITKDENVLIAQATGQSAFPLEAVEKDKFKFDQAGIVLEFTPIKNEMILKQGGGVFTFNKE